MPTAGWRRRRSLGAHPAAQLGEADGRRVGIDLVLGGPTANLGLPILDPTAVVGQLLLVVLVPRRASGRGG